MHNQPSINDNYQEEKAVAKTALFPTLTAVKNKKLLKNSSRVVKGGATNEQA